ncbi:MFS general substrate transporter [Gonapodya prolifera JEL478]|uniref:MFS general substrate transporter n=1 Tax=Gonapodya prolifera (strain JEL478) TaxID=1344416 RepID=A0A139AA39_GONPJ|nr:MFS general substrate transporter [Gonapodya prolifera JEL478]|eukprot:KXS13365.1 MFS general substrate transporter [Gonapodya prolifera JEL478]
MFGLLLSIFLAALDQSIVATAVPKIITDFQDITGISWISTAYLVTTTALIPIFGTLGTIFGLKRTFLSAIFVFEVGSLLCGAAPSMPALIIGRAVAGIGKAGLFISVIVIISEMVGRRENAKYQASFALVYAVSGVCGPLIGGALTDGIGWRWCFYLNLPVGLIATVLVILLVPSDPPSKSGGTLISKLRRIDFLGCFLLCASMLLILVPLSLGGVQYKWSDAIIIVMLVIGVALIPILAWVELRHPEPIILPSLFRNPNAVVVFTAAFFGGMVYNATIYYVPVYLQVAHGSTALASGLITVPFILSIQPAVLLSGWGVARWGKFGAWWVAGGLGMVVGTALLTTLDEGSGDAKQIGIMILCGISIGLYIQLPISGAQNAVEGEMAGKAIAVANFFGVLGPVFGIAVTSTVFTNTLSSSLTRLAPHASLSWVQNHPVEVRSAPPNYVPPEEIAGAVRAFVESLRAVFYVTVGMGACLVVAAVGTVLVGVSIVDEKGTNEKVGTEGENELTIVDTLE